jgi:orotate phosphoribosyltransferase
MGLTLSGSVHTGISCSGATSREYFDKYLFESDPAMLCEIAENMVD